jgi:hypothetical protein
VLIGIDLYVKNRYLLRMLSRPEQRLHLVGGSSRSPRTLERVRRALGGRGLDLLFIDGDHGYEGVKHDYVTYGALVRKGGIIALHDICGDSGCGGTGGAAWVGGVPRLWTEIRDVHEHREFVQRPGQFGFGIGAVVQDAPPGS